MAPCARYINYINCQLLLHYVHWALWALVDLMRLSAAWDLHFNALPEGLPEGSLNEKLLLLVLFI